MACCCSHGHENSGSIKDGDCTVFERRINVKNINNKSFVKSNNNNNNNNNNNIIENIITRTTTRYHSIATNFYPA